MKLTSFNCTIELSKDENGYSNNYYIDVTDKGVSISHPYVTQTPEQVMFVTNLIHDFIAQAIVFNARIDGFNRDNHLEQYAPQVSSIEEPASESTDISAVPQPSHGTRSNNLDYTDLVAHSEAEQERLDMEEELYKEAELEIKDAPFEEVETAMDKAKTPEEMLEVMIASGERKEVRDLPM